LNGVCLITGGTSGLGFATAHRLAARGAKVVIVGRRAAKADAAARAIADLAGGAAVDWLAADFAVQQQVRNLAAEFEQRYSRLDVLVNNAGAIIPRRQVTPEGVDLTLAVNHLAPFLLTNLLRPVLLRSAPSRVINVSSVAHERAQLDPDHLAPERMYIPFRAYARSKLANLLFTFELARRLEGTGVTVNAVDPGLVRTGLGRGNGLLRDAAWRLTRLRYRKLYLSPEQAADTICFLATSPSVASATGKYFFERRPVPSSDRSIDSAAAERLWSTSERLTRLSPARESATTNGSPRSTSGASARMP
jgi:retinol dehydrogenase 12